MPAVEISPPYALWHSCLKRIYEVPKFIFYAFGYAIERKLKQKIDYCADWI